MIKSSRRFIPLIVVFMVTASAAGDTWWKDSASQNDKLEEVLGAPLSSWEVTTHPPGKTAPPLKFKTIDGRQALSKGGLVSLTLNGLVDHTPYTEYLIKFKFSTAKASSCWLSVHIGREHHGKLEAGPIGIGVVILNNNQIQCTLTNPYAERAADQRIIAQYKLKGYRTRRLGWPEDFRKRVEHDFAALPSATGKWFTLRIVTKGNVIKAYIDDRMFARVRTLPENLSGKTRITLAGNTILGSVRTARVSADPVYEPLKLKGYLNAAKINGRRLDRDYLPLPDTEVFVGGVPFVFPDADDNGNDHIDVGRSWPQHGALTGYLTANYPGLLGGRWATPLTINPRRIAISIPKAQYCKVHLIAAADSEKDSVPVVSAQFFRPHAGYPRQYEAEVPLFTEEAETVTPFPVKLANGKWGSLYHIVIPIDPGDLAELAQMDRDVPYMVMELTKKVRLYRSYPDPISYSYLGSGRPSGVHIYAATLERPPVDMRITPDVVGHVWTSPETPSYTITLTNISDVAKRVNLRVGTCSFDKNEKTKQKRTVTVGAHKDASAKFMFKLKRYGYHELTVATTTDGRSWTGRRSLAFLHPDTRERGNWQNGQGPIFGFWSYGGGHITPPVGQSMEVMARAGMETKGGSLAEKRYTPEIKQLAEKWGISTFKYFSAWDHWITGRYASNLAAKDPEEADRIFLKELNEHLTKPSKITRPETISFFPEPHIGPITAGNWPSYYGEAEYQLTEHEKKKMEYYRKALVRGGKLVRKHWPDCKILFPHGNPLFCVPFLRHCPETRDLIDGVAVDSPNFERLPEMQIWQETIHRLYQMKEEFKKINKDPYLIFLEGNFVPTADGACTWEEQADLVVRNTLGYIAYGINRLNTIFCSYDAANYYGEEHYGNSYICSRYPLACPKPSYCAVAALTRHLNRANFVKPVPTGSNTVFCLQFKHYKTGELIHVMWTVRGTRPVTISVANNVRVERFDHMDNAAVLQPKDGAVTFEVSDSVCYIRGLVEDPKISLGDPDHSDARRGEISRKLGNLGDGSWRIRAERDPTYENNHPLQIARFLGKMSVRPVPGPEDKGSKALSVHLEKQDKERVTMPWYTVLVPRRPIVIPGKASHLGIWVRANSDWGRVIYSLRDAKGERWVSIGTREQWNVDDIHCRSKFCFDGWRYLRFEMPSNSPYDTFREHGTTWWGHFDKGDGIVDLPLKLEKIIVERRTHVMVVNRPEVANTGDVLLADLYAEYAAPEDRTGEAVRLSRLRMPVPKGVPDLSNPIEEMRAAGIGSPIKSVNITTPPQWADGTQCDVHFDLVEGAKQYDLWVAPYSDGTGAMHLGKAWQKSGLRLRGLRPETDFYLFVFYTDKDGKMSKPPRPLKIYLRDLFFQK